MIDLIGKIFGRLTVVSRENNDKWGHSKWLCICICGKKTVCHIANLRSGSTQSCGCFNKEKTREVCTTHGYCGTKIYHIWDGIIQRCTNPKASSYKIYGGRGIKVCQRWNKFENFLNDMGDRPTDEHQIDRINNDGDYSPDNCKWSTKKQQARNKRNNRLITHNGKTLCIAAWGEKTGICRKVITYRLKAGWSINKTLTTPTGKYRSKQ